MTFLCSTILEITLGPLLVLCARRAVLNVAKSPPTVTPAFPGDVPCWSPSVFQSLLAGLQLQKVMSCQLWDASFRRWLKECLGDAGRDWGVIAAHGGLA